MSKIKMFPSAEFLDGEIRRVELDASRAITVYKVDGLFYATDDHCTHGNASLAGGDLDGYEIICPFHGGAFDIRTGDATRPPCIRELKVHAVAEEDGFLCLVKLDN